MEDPKAPELTDSPVESITQKSSASKPLNLPVIISLAIVIIGCLATAGYLYWRGSQVPSGEENTNTNSDTETDIDDTEDTNAEEEETEEPTTVSFNCPAYGADEGQNPEAKITFTIPSGVEIEQNGTNECNLLIKYSGATLQYVYTVGEAFASSIEDDFVEIEEEGDITVVRDGLKENSQTQTLSTHYTKLLSEQECNDNKEIFDTEYPCGIGGHPLITNLGQTNISIPKIKTANEVADIINVFDQIVTNAVLEKFETASTNSDVYKITIDEKSGYDVSAGYPGGESLLTDYLVSLLGISTDDIQNIAWNTDEETPYNSEVSIIRLYVVTESDIAGTHDDAYASTTVESIDPNIEPYLQNTDYCEEPSDCVVRNNFCAYGSYNKYHPYIDVWGCEMELTDETGYEYGTDIIDPDLGCQTEVNFTGSTCSNNVCTGTGRTVTCVE